MSGFKYNLGVVGLGYVGLPLAVDAVSSGLSVIGYDIFVNLLSPSRHQVLSNVDLTAEKHLQKIY